MMRVLITGGAGFIGSNLAQYHVDRNHEVVVVDNLSTGSEDNIKHLLKENNFTFYHDDMATWDGLTKEVAKCDRVYHFAAYVGVFHVLEHPLSTLQGNIDTTNVLFEALQQADKKPYVVVASTSEVYGNQSGKMSEMSPIIIEEVARYQSTYTISKLCNEATALLYFRKFDIPGFVLRLFNTIGRNQCDRYGMVVPRFISQAKQNKPITVFGNGSQIRSFCDVRDTVKMIDLLVGCRKSLNEIINVGNDSPITIVDLANLVIKLSKSKSELTYTPLSDVYHNEDVFIQQREPDMRKCLDLTSYEYQWTLEDTIKDLLDSY